MDYIKSKPEVVVARTISCKPQDLRDIADLMERASKPDHEVILNITNDIALVYKAPFESQFSPSVARESDQHPTH